MIKKLILSVICLSCIVCAPKEKYVKLANKSLTKVVLTITPVNISNKSVRIATGVLISPYGHVLSCAHNLKRNESIDKIIVETYYNKTFDAKIIAIDLKKDLSLLKIEHYTPNYAILAKPGSLKIGQEIMLIGHPLDFDWTVSVGIISGLNRDQIQYNLLQTNIIVEVGSSGGPIFNQEGKLVGIMTHRLKSLCFGVEVSQIYEFLIKCKKISK